MKKLRLLCAKGDDEALQPVLDALAQKGVRIAEGGEGMTLCALSEAFYADEGCTNALFALLSRGGDKVLPLQLDGAPIPERIKNALYARNIIPAEGRGSEQLAERIAAAISDKPNRLPWVFGLAGAVLLAVIGILVWRSAGTGEEALPAMAQTDYDFAIPEGLSAEELAQVRCVVIVGDHFRYYTQEERLTGEDGHWPCMLYELANFMSTPENETRGIFDWYWNEDGSKVSMASYDLRFLSLMPNLEELQMAMAEVTDTPDLSASEKLRVVWAFECELPDLGWLADSPAERLSLRGHMDYAALGKSASLREFFVDCYPDAPADFSAFSPANLELFDIVCWNVDSIDLSGLGGCGGLQCVRLCRTPIADISFLAHKPELTDVSLVDIRGLSLSALGGDAALQYVGLWGCEDVSDLDALADCAELDAFDFGGVENARLDLSFLSELPRLKNLTLEDVELEDLEFLRGLGDNAPSFRLFLRGKIGDYAALEAITSYDELTLCAQDGAPLSRITPYLENAGVRTLTLEGFSEVDLSALTVVSSALELNRCALTDLGTMPEDWAAARLSLRNCSRLRTLDGLQNQTKLGTLEVEGCARLTDWSALRGMKLNTLSIVGGYTLPSLEGVEISELRIDSVADVSDLDFMKELDESRSYSFALLGLEELRSLAPLSRFHGVYLTVSPELGEQAEDLVSAGNFRVCRIEYPRGGWSMDNEPVDLASLSEMETLPNALLRRVERLCLAGDMVVDTERFEVVFDWERCDARGRPGLLLRERSTGEETPVEPGTMQDVRALSALTGLRELRIYAQPLESLDGAQELSELRLLSVSGCQELTDASAAFAAQSLECLDLGDTSVSSIQGAQNLTQLRELHLPHTRVTDLTPLLELTELRELYVSSDMDAALQSLKGQSVGFEIIQQG